MPQARARQASNGRLSGGFSMADNQGFEPNGNVEADARRPLDGPAVCSRKISMRCRPRTASCRHELVNMMRANKVGLGVNSRSPRHARRHVRRRADGGVAAVRPSRRRLGDAEVHELDRPLGRIMRWTASVAMNDALVMRVLQGVAELRPSVTTSSHVSRPRRARRGRAIRLAVLHRVERVRPKATADEKARDVGCLSCPGYRPRLERAIPVSPERTAATSS